MKRHTFTLIELSVISPKEAEALAKVETHGRGSDVVIPEGVSVPRRLATTPDPSTSKRKS